MQEDEYVMPEMSDRATMIPARYTEVLSNLMYYPDTKTAIDEAMSDYPLYQTDPDAVRQYGTAYKVPTRQELNTKRKPVNEETGMWWWRGLDEEC